MSPAPDADRGPNAPLIGRPADEFAALAATPALAIDIRVFRTNLLAMQQAVRHHGKALRPHMKAHKCTRIAQLQRDAGAIGISCATAREAELAAAAGLDGILLTTPVLSSMVLGRLARLQAPGRFLFAIDGPEALDRLAMAFAGVAPAGVLIDINVGQNRTGLGSSEAAVALARRVIERSGLTLLGLQAYYGHLQHVPSLADRRSSAGEQWRRLHAVIAALGAAGLPPTIVSGGGTGTADLDLAEGPFTEIQPGSYLFMDSQYGAIEHGAETAGLGNALSVLARVTSATVADQVLIDAGTKAISTDPATMRYATPALLGASHRFMGDEHSALTFQPGAARPAVGDLVALYATHCDPTVNLHDRFHVMEDGRLIDIWPIAARGY